MLISRSRPPLLVPVCSNRASPSAQTSVSIASAYCPPASVCVPVAPSLAWFQSPMLPAARTAGPSMLRGLPLVPIV